jgi:hypothetical protein
VNLGNRRDHFLGAGEGTGFPLDSGTDPRGNVLLDPRSDAYQHEGRDQSRSTFAGGYQRGEAARPDSDDGGANGQLHQHRLEIS